MKIILRKKVLIWTILLVSVYSLVGQEDRTLVGQTHRALVGQTDTPTDSLFPLKAESDAVKRPYIQVTPC